MPSIITNTHSSSYGSTIVHDTDDRQHPPNARVRTPLPARQISILMLLRFCESAANFSIYPFLEELLTSVIGGDRTQVGYYAGIIEFVRNLVSIFTIMYWSRVSDHIGRKPVLILGTAALGISMLCFGLSKTFWTLVLSRCIFTAFNSNAGTIKSSIGEITDHTNSADAFALLHAPWAAGISFGSLVGGWLANPKARYPRLFPQTFWKTYPYFLPCATIALLSFVGLAFTLIGLKETLPGKSPRHQSYTKESDDTEPLLNDPDPSYDVDSNNRESLSARSKSDPVPIRDLLTFQILIPLTNYITLAFLHTSSNSIMPLFLAMPISIGGLGLSPASIGSILSVYGAANSVFQTFCLGRLVRFFGVKRVFVMSIMASFPVFSLYAAMNIVASSAGRTTNIVYFLLFVQLSSLMLMECGYGCIYMFITSTAPNKRSLGSTHGLGQTMVSVMRMIAPAFAGTLLSLSIQRQIFWGYGVYAALFVLSIASLVLAKKLPEGLREDDE